MRRPLVPDQLRSGPFTTVQARALGISRSALRSAPWRNVFRDVWAYDDLPDSRALRFAAVRLILPEGAFVCGMTAAWLYGIEAQDRRQDLIWYGCRTGRKLRTRPGCLCREITVDDPDVQFVDGLYVTTPLRTVFDCGRWLSLVEAVVVADALMHSELVSPAQLVTYARSHRRLRGVRQIDRVIEFVEPKSDSPMETRVRLLIVLAGFPSPESQLIIRDRSQLIVARADLGYEAARFLIEYDGALHWEQRRADDRRRDLLRDLGWDILVVSSEDYYQTPGMIIAKVRAALATAA